MTLAPRYYNVFVVETLFPGLNRQRAQAVRQPFLSMIAVAGLGLGFTIARRINAFQPRLLWDPDDMRTAQCRPGRRAPAARRRKTDTGRRRGARSSTAQIAVAPASATAARGAERLADALFAATRHRSVALHFQRGLGDASEKATGAVRDASTNSVVLDGFVLAIIGGSQPGAFPGLHGHEPDFCGAPGQPPASCPRRRRTGHLYCVLNGNRSAVARR